MEDQAWSVVDDHHLERTFAFPDFVHALLFVNAVALFAERANHHPDIELGWGKVVVKLRTHDEKRVGPKDHALAKLIDSLG